ncbi:hypothetical protein [Streptomyces sp. NBC_01465]|uniref:hypothetical protein n=1 Tax=Streptomyces sp. NBC_01465 TaxID=2903878 RepID=UPI002E306685|nr:hypothetical protein [Streptomyces sp. NBC_01465]
MRYVRITRAHDDEVDLFELGDDHRPVRQVTLTGPDRTPTVAADLDEITRLRANWAPVVMELYEQTYGVLTETPVPAGEAPESCAESVSSRDFALAWGAARSFRQCEVPNDSGPFPDGTRLTGTVARTPWPSGVTGLFVDLGLPVGGFVDVVHLPYDGADWPAEDTVVAFEIVTVRAWPPQIRLRPLDGLSRRTPPRGSPPPAAPSPRPWPP